MPAALPSRQATPLLLMPLLVLALTPAATWLVWDHERETARNALHTHVQTVMLDANFSRIQDIGVVQPVPVHAKGAHVEAMRQLGLDDYAIYPEGPRELYAPIVQREPDIDRTLAPLGFDAWTEPVRRQATERARGAGQERASVAQRRAHLMGRVYASNAAHHVTEQVCDAMRRQFVINGRELTISCSVGIARYPHDGSDEATLTKRADQAMYRAKASGRDSVMLSTF